MYERMCVHISSYTGHNLSQLELYAVNGFNDIDFSQVTSSSQYDVGTIYCATDYSQSCDIMSGVWECDGNLSCDNVQFFSSTTYTPTSSPTTANPTTSAPTTMVPTTISPTIGTVNHRKNLESTSALISVSKAPSTPITTLHATDKTSTEPSISQHEHTATTNKSITTKTPQRNLSEQLSPIPFIDDTTLFIAGGIFGVFLCACCICCCKKCTQSRQKSTATDKPRKLRFIYKTLHIYNNLCT